MPARVVYDRATRIQVKEPSTWQGLITVLTLVGIALGPEQREAIVSAGVALYALLDVFWLHNSKRL